MKKITNLTKRSIHIFAISSSLFINACMEEPRIKNENGNGNANEKELKSQLQGALKKVQHYENLTTQSLFEKVGDKAVEDKVKNHEGNLQTKELIQSYYTYLRKNENLSTYLDMKLVDICPA